MEYSFQEALLNKHFFMKMVTPDERLFLQVHLLEELLLTARSPCSTLSVHCVTINSYVITLLLSREIRYLGSNIQRLSKASIKA